MKSEKVLELLNSGKTEELKAMLQDEIYSNNLNCTKGDKQRYQAMKRYFKTDLGNIRESMQKPCKVDEYFSFLDGYSVVLTNENIGEIEEYDNSKDDYFKAGSLVKLDGKTEKINLNQVLADAKSKGYKFKRDELGNSQEFKYVFKYKDSFYKIGILDQAYSIINDGELAEVTYQKELSPLLIETKIGKCIVLPIRAASIINKIIIEVNNEDYSKIA